MNNNTNSFNYFLGYSSFISQSQMPYSSYPQLSYHPFNADIQSDTSITPEHLNRSRTLNSASSSLDINIDVCKNVRAFMDLLIQNNPQDAQVLEEAKVVFLTDDYDVEVLKTMTREDADYWKLKWGICKRIARDMTIYLKKNSKTKC